MYYIHVQRCVLYMHKDIYVYLCTCTTYNVHVHVHWCVLYMHKDIYVYLCTCTTLVY